MLKTVFSRPFACVLAGLLAGLALGPWKPAWLWGWLALVACLPAIGTFLAGRLRWCAVFFLACGLLAGVWKAGVPPRLVDEAGFPAVRAARMEGRVLELSPGKAGERQAACLLDNVRLKNLLRPADVEMTLAGTLRLSCDPASLPPGLKPGDQVRAFGGAHPPRPAGNPGQPDFLESCLARGTTFLGNARPGGISLLRSGSPWNARACVYAARAWLERGLQACLGPSQAGLMAGILLGDKSGLARGDLEDYARSGLSYLLAVAGLHLALVVGLFLRLAGRLGLSRPWRAGLGLAVMIAYAATSGFQVPVMRAGILFVLYFLGQAFDLETDFISSLCFGAVVILLLQPQAAAEAGFQFSFGVTAGIVFLAPRLKARLLAALPPPAALPGQPAWKAWLRRPAPAAAEWLGVCLAAQAAVIPVQAWHFCDFTWTALFSNLLASLLLPVILGLGLVCCLIGRIPVLAIPPAWLLSKALACLDLIHSFFAHLPGAVLSTGRPPLWWMAAWALVCLALIPALGTAWRGRPVWSRVVQAGLPLLLGVLLLLPRLDRHPGVTRAWFFDVGQGDAILVQFPDQKTLLVDGGPLRPDAGVFVIAPALRWLGISGLDWVACTHPHADHFGGLGWVLAEFPVGAFLDSGQSPGAGEEDAAGGASGAWQEFQASLAKAGVPVFHLRAGLPLPPDLAGRAEVLSPRPALLRGSRRDTDDNGLVLRVGGWLWLAADTGLRAEQRLAGAGLVPPTPVLKVGHHGSLSSSGEDFLAALKPSLAVIQAGEGNQFGFPRQATLDHLRPFAGLGRTDLQGCIRVEHASDRLDIQGFRPCRENPWLAPAKPAWFRWKQLHLANN